MGQILKLHITLAAGASNPSAAFAPQKYNKLAFSSQQFDDGSRGSIVCKNLFQNYTYTDGCGNQIPYSASVGLNGGTGVPGSLAYNASYLQNADLQPLIAAGFDVENHSMYHRSGTPLPDTIQLDDIIKMYVLYEIQGLIIPTDYLGYTDAAKQIGMLFSTGQGEATFDSLAPGNNETVPAHLDFYGMVRDFYDDWATGDVTNQKAKVDDLITGARNFYVIGTHSALDTDPILAGFTQLYDYIHTTAADRLLVCSLREALEYKSVKALPMTQTFADNVLTVEIDTTTLSERTRWKDVSLNITSNTAITGVTVEGFTSSSFNSTTKLVNGFLQKTSWPGTATYVPDADQTINVKHGKFVVS